MKSLNPVRRLAPLMDVMAIALAGVLASEVRFGSARLDSGNALVLVLVALAVVLINLFGGGYSKWRSTRLRSRIYRLLWVWAAVFAVLASLLYLFKLSESVSRQWLVFTFLLSFCLVCASRSLLMMLTLYHNASAKNRRKVFLVGPEENLLDVARSLRRHREQGYALAGICARGCCAASRRRAIWPSGWRSRAPMRCGSVCRSPKGPMCGRSCTTCAIYRWRSASSRTSPIFRCSTIGSARSPAITPSISASAPSPAAPSGPNAWRTS